MTNSPRIALSFFFAVLFSLLAARASAAPVVTENFEYFDISGATAGEIRAQLRQFGPLEATTGQHFDAYTKWFVAWKYTYKNVAQGCTIDRVSTTVEVIFIFPRLKAGTAMPATLKEAFTGYLDKLLLHEKGHAQNGIQIAGRIEDGIRSLPPQPNCAALGRVANALGNTLLREGGRMDVDYDVRTNHGATQGARFP